MQTNWDSYDGWNIEVFTSNTSDMIVKEELGKMPNRVFQVAYHQELLRVREMILQQKGFVVYSVIGNSEAFRSLGGEAFRDQAPFDCFVIGWSGSYEEKKSITEWLKEKWPRISVVAIHDPFVKIPKADITATHETPEKWIRAVVAATNHQMNDQVAAA